VLRAFTELYCNFWGKLSLPSLRKCNAINLMISALEDRVFSLKTPSSFFTMFGNLGGAAAGDLAMEAFEDDVQVTSRAVSRACCPEAISARSISQ
jgi:syntaxin-binding protein 1